ncbi:MAG: NUDIX domain-containing protein [Candidatus Nomurabacteria bacterium]|nr:NUDIX domain-containing protein [Candidatus Nomurabacteria bacterium]
MNEMEINGKAVYFVAVKVFLRDKEKLLVIFDKWGVWELPGGRIKPDDFQKPLVETVSRKIREELGDGVRYSEPKPTGTFIQVSRTEETGENVRIFAIGFEAEYLGGEIDLGDHHEELRWVDVGTFRPLELQDNDWMRGVEDYLEQVRGGAK